MADVDSDNLDVHSLQIETVNIPPADGGSRAYTTLFGCALLQLPVWGFPVSYGILQAFYTSPGDPLHLSGSIDATGLIGTTMNGIIYLSMPFLFGVFSHRWSRFRRLGLAIGTGLIFISLLASAYATSVWQLILTQAVAQALGATLLYSCSTIYLDEWFIRRKAFAYGTILSVKSAVGAGTPPLFSLLLNALGYKKTMLVWAGVVLIMSAPALVLLNSRRPATESVVVRQRREGWSFLRHFNFYLLQLGNIVFSAGYGLPMTYVSSFARLELGLTSWQSALLLVSLNSPSIISSYCFGVLGDGAPVRWLCNHTLSMPTVRFVSALGSCLPALLLWGLTPIRTTHGELDSAGISLLSIFTIVYGFFAGGYSATWGGSVQELAGEARANNEAIDTGLLYGLLNGGRGLGFVVGGIIGVQLVQSHSGQTGAAKPSAVDSKLAYATEYGNVIILTGTSAAVSALSAYRYGFLKSWYSART